MRKLNQKLKVNTYKKLKFFILPLLFIYYGCNKFKEIDKYEIDCIKYSNFSVLETGLDDEEEVQIILNNEYLYQSGLQKKRYTSYRFFKIPNEIFKIEVINRYKGDLINNKIFNDLKKVPKQIIIYKKKNINKKQYQISKTQISLEYNDKKNIEVDCY